ncbi:MAG: RnfABCDGE type electron transport complex subunit G, partial [Duncaniella sp.]|nr:RnfABCDGE type electron transport complex subunit G [Duncaniella sp.]
GVITVVAAAALAGVYTATEQPIAEATLQAEIQAVSDVTPAFDNDPVAEQVAVTPEGEAQAVTVFPAMKDGALVGAAVESYTNNGFSGFIKVIYGFDTEGNVTGFAVMEHAETPGLGAKMGDWFRSPEGNRNVIGVNASGADLTVAKDGGSVDAITAATITSRAFLDALNRAARAFNQYKAQN